MFIFLSELMIFVSIIGWVMYSFDNSKNLTKINDINLANLIMSVNGTKYENIKSNTKTNKEKWVVYKEVVLEFKDGDLNPNLCTLLNKK